MTVLGRQPTARETSRSTFSGIQLNNILIQIHALRFISWRGRNYPGSAHRSDSCKSCTAPLPAAHLIAYERLKEVRAAAVLPAPQSKSLGMGALYINLYGKLPRGNVHPTAAQEEG